MDTLFYFDEIRLSVRKENQIALRGFAEDGAMVGMSISAIFGDDILETECIETNAPMERVRKLGIIGVNKNITILIDLPEDISTHILKKDKLTVSISRGEDVDKNEIYSCTADKCQKIISSLNACVDSSTIDSNGLIIKGWAIDAAELDFALTSGGEELPIDITWNARQDLATYYPEITKSITHGFTITSKSKNKKAVLTIKSSNSTSAQKTKEFFIRPFRTDGKGMVIYKLRANGSRAKNYLRRNGLKQTIARATEVIAPKKKPITDYNEWIRKRMPSSRILQEQTKIKFGYMPKFSILVPLYNTKERFLTELVDSVIAQTYSNWELCFSDGSPKSDTLKKLIKDKWGNENRIKYIAEKKGPLGISENTNQALSIATGDYIVLGDHDDLFTPDALFECARAINKDLDYEVIYTDEDKTDENSKEYFEPHFKSDFNLDLLRCNNYICHMFVAKKSLVDKVGGFIKEFDGAQDYDFIFRCVEKAKKIHHIPKILYRWRVHRDSTAGNPESKLYAFEAGKRAIEAHYDRVGLKAKVENTEHLGYYVSSFELDDKPLISIIIPNKDHMVDLKKCIDSIDKLSTYKNYEFIIVENNSVEEETFAYYKELETRDNVKVLFWDKYFNYSAINNFGVEHANGEYILFLNNDTEIINTDCLEQLLSYCQRDDVGIVGAKLLYEDGTIQHAGVIVGVGGVANHAFCEWDDSKRLSYNLRSSLPCNYSAVTAACMMTEKSIFKEVGGFEEDFAVAFNDVDFCMKVRELGKLIVYNPYAKLFHYESKSRGYEDTPEKIERFKGEIDLFRQRWMDFLQNVDPYYNPNFNQDKADYTLRND